MKTVLPFDVAIVEYKTEDGSLVGVVGSGYSLRSSENQNTIDEHADRIPYYEEAFNIKSTGEHVTVVAGTEIEYDANTFIHIPWLFSGVGTGTFSLAPFKE